MTTVESTGVTFAYGWEGAVQHLGSKSSPEGPTKSKRNLSPGAALNSQVSPVSTRPASALATSGVINLSFGDAVEGT